MNMLRHDRRTPKFQIEIKKNHTKKVPKDYSLKFKFSNLFACLVVHSSSNQMQIKLEKKKKIKLKKLKVSVKMGPYQPTPECERHWASI